MPENVVNTENVRVNKSKFSYPAGSECVGDFRANRTAPKHRDVHVGQVGIGATSLPHIRRRMTSHTEQFDWATRVNLTVLYMELQPNQGRSTGTPRDGQKKVDRM
jgi:hypothetical protein